MVTYNLDALASDTAFPYNVHLGQDELCALVLERLAELPHATVSWRTRVTAIAPGSADEIRVTVESATGTTNVYFDFHAHGYTRSVFLMDDVHGAVIAKINDGNLWRVTYAEDLSLPEEATSDAGSSTRSPHPQRHG